MSENEGDVDDLFGSGSDEDDAAQQHSQEKAVSSQGAAEPDRGQDYEDEDMDDEDGGFNQEPVRPVGEPLVLDAVAVDPPSSEDIRLVRMSNILGVEKEQFLAKDFRPEDETYEDEMGQKRVRLKDQHTIRWRYAEAEDGSQIKQSNARFVRWSDGSLQLLLGKEVLDIAELDISNDNNYLFLRHRTPAFMEGQALIATKMAFRPASLNSTFHKRLTAAVDKRHSRVFKVRHAATIADPHREKVAREKAEEARIRDKAVLSRRQDREMRKYTAPTTSAARSTFNTSFLEAQEEEEEEEEYSDDEDMSATNRARAELARRRPTRDEEEVAAERRLANAKREALQLPREGSAKKHRGSQRAEFEQEEADDEELGDFIVDDEDDMAAKRQQKGNRRVLQLSDDED